MFNKTIKISFSLRTILLKFKHARQKFKKNCIGILLVLTALLKITGEKIFYIKFDKILKQNKLSIGLNPHKKLAIK